VESASASAALMSALPKWVADQPGEVSFNRPVASATRSPLGAAFHCSKVTSGVSCRSNVNTATWSAGEVLRRSDST